MSRYLPAWQGLGPSVLLGRRRPGPRPYPLDAPHAWQFYVARSGIYHLFRALGLPPGSTVLAPAYHSGNETRAIRAAGLGVRFYPVDRNMECPLGGIEERLDGSVRALLVIHYVGWAQPVARLREWCDRRGLVLFEDCALSWLSSTPEGPLGSVGDYSVFCLYKTAPVPHGAVLASNRGPVPGMDGVSIRPPSGLSTLARGSELGLEWLRGRWNAPGALLLRMKQGVGSLLSGAGVDRAPVGDMGFDLSRVHIGVSPFARRILSVLDYGDIRARRRENYERLAQLLGGTAVPVFRSLPEGTCPLFYPLLVAEKGAAAEVLRRRGIQATEFWNYGDPELRAGEFPESDFLRRHVLELPIHQDIRPDQLEYMARVVRDTGICLR